MFHDFDTHAYTYTKTHMLLNNSCLPMTLSSIYLILAVFTHTHTHIYIYIYISILCEKSETMRKKKIWYHSDLLELSDDYIQQVKQ